MRRAACGLWRHARNGDTVRMTTHDFMQLDVFAAAPGLGNPLGVVEIHVDTEGEVWIAGRTQTLIAGRLSW